MNASLRFVAALSLALLGCLQVTPLDGALQCSRVGSQCPPGYWCAGDHTCWQRDHRPGAHAADMGVPDDMTTTGRDASTATGGDDMTTGQADMANAIMSCVDATDCPAPSRPCLVPACIHGACGNAVASAGTVLPAALQTPGDCQKLTCDGNGNATPTADTSDLPVDPSGGCNTPHCNGSTPVLTPVATGGKCGTSGVCNGKGICGVCLPNAQRCKGTTTTVQTCSVDGQWVDGMTCQFACTSGTCTGVCDPAMYPSQCAGPTSLSTCGSDHQIHTASCPVNAPACCKNACTGTCTPSGKGCTGNNVTWCDQCGVAQTQVCANTCVNGACADCTPNAHQCCTAGDGNSGVQQCDASGHWGACSSCGGGYNQCNGTSCVCNAPDPCGGVQCGTVTDGCGFSVSCGGCAANELCSGNTCVPTTTDTTQTTSTTRTTGCGCVCCVGDQCCSS